MKKVVTVTLGSSKQDFEFKTEFLGQSFSVKRMGADDDTGKAWELMRRQQATADAIGTAIQVRQLAAAAARRIENLYFDRRHRTDTIVRVSGQSDFCDSATEARIALDKGGRVLDATPIDQRPAATSFYSGVSSIGAASGPSLGALAVDQSSWRVAFFLGLPMLGASFALGRRTLPVGVKVPVGVSVGVGEGSGVLDGVQVGRGVGGANAASVGTISAACGLKIGGSSASPAMPSATAAAPMVSSTNSTVTRLKHPFRTRFIASPPRARRSGRAVISDQSSVVSAPLSVFDDRGSGVSVSTS